MESLDDWTGAFWYDQEFPTQQDFVTSPPDLLLPMEPQFVAAPLAAPPAGAPAGLPPAPASAVPAASATEPRDEQQSEPPQKKQAAARRTGGGRTATQLSQDEKQARLEAQRARNRVNQARYRERQNAKNATLAAQHDATAADLQRARQEQVELAQLNGVLEKLLAVRDTAVGILETAGSDASFTGGTVNVALEPSGSGVDGGSSSGAIPPAALSPALPSSQHPNGYITPHLEELRGTPSGSVSAGSAGGTQDSTGTGTACGSAERQASLKQQQGLKPSPDVVEATPELLAARDHLSRTIISHMHLPMDTSPEALAARWEKDPSLSPKAEAEALFNAEAQALAVAAHLQPQLLEKVRSQTPEQFIEEWRCMQLVLRDTLTEWELTKHDALLHRLQPVLQQKSVIMSLALRHRPELLRALFATSGQAEPVFWEQVVRVMEPTPQQRAMLQTLWEAYASKVSRLRAEQAGLMQQMASLASQEHVTPDSLIGRSLNSMVSQYLSLLDHAGQLHMYKESEYVALLQLMSSYGRVFTPLQKARVAAASYPCFPDIIQIVRLEVERGRQQGLEPQGQQLQAAQPGHQQQQLAASPQPAMLEQGSAGSS